MRVQTAFLLLVIVQAAHSVEEYLGKLYESFAPARFVSGLVNDDLAVGFLIANACLVAFGLWCWAVPVRSGWSSARSLLWVWVVIEIGNGVAHPAFAIARGGYFPGLITAPLLLALAAWLGVRLGSRVSGEKPDSR